MSSRQWLTRVSWCVVVYWRLAGIDLTGIFCMIVVVNGEVAVEGLGTAVWCTGELDYLAICSYTDAHCSSSIPR